MSSAVSLAGWLSPCCRAQASASFHGVLGRPDGCEGQVVSGCEEGSGGFNGVD
jgi:hypothetical protein